MSRALVVAPGDKQQALGVMLAQQRTKMAALLKGTPLTPDRLCRIVLNATTRLPSLLDCTPKSIVLAAMQGAELGLEVGGVLGEAYIVPFFNNREQRKIATYMNGYKGLIKLAEQSPRVIGVEARLVRQGERFEVAYGTSPAIFHEPRFDDAAPVTHAYAVAHKKGGLPQFVVMTRAELDRIRDEALRRAYKPAESTWTKYEAEMQTKSPIRKLAKFVPLSERGRTAIELETMQSDDPAKLSPTVELIEGELVE